MNEEQRIREEAIFRCCSEINGVVSSCKKEDCPNCGFRIPGVEQAIDQILSLKGIRIEAENQDLPEPDMDTHIWRDYSPDMAYEKAQQDMLTPKDGKVWVKCCKKEEQ